MNDLIGHIINLDLTPEPHHYGPTLRGILKAVDAYSVTIDVDNSYESGVYPMLRVIKIEHGEVQCGWDQRGACEKPN